MSRERLANAFDKAAEAFAELALELRANEPEAARASVAASVPTGAPVAPAGGPPPSSAGATRYEPQGAFTRCPAHDREWKPSKFPDGPGYCTAQSDDPEWSKNGYCAITERSAPVWMRKHAA